jgi:uncharacterized SAM-binding protein YcdF (DUF218 family)
MAEVLARQGLGAGRLVLDEASLDTLQSVIATARLVQQCDLDGVIVCSDRYHLPRIRLMLGALGVLSRAGPTAGLPGPRLSYGLRMWLREALAIPYDLAIVMGRRAEFMRIIAADQP